jgi:O-antigen/teichoic acid export membrane protein
MAFYYPLALTSILGLGVYPIVTFFMGHSRMALESLAVLPVVNALVFVFRSLGLSFQEVGVALLGEKKEGYKPLRKFAGVLGFCVTAALAVIAFTPLSSIWFRGISGLSAELCSIAVTPTRIMTIMPGLIVLLSFQRAFLVNSMNTKPINMATMIEVAGIVTFLIITVFIVGMIGALAAAISLLLGRLFANAYLFVPYWRELNKLNKAGAAL